MDGDDDPEADDGLEELLDLIAGRGKYRGHGAGLWTHPGDHAEEDAIHAQCLELERRGLVRRKESDAVTRATLWQARPGLRIAD